MPRFIVSLVLFLILLWNSQCTPSPKPANVPAKPTVVPIQDSLEQAEYDAMTDQGYFIDNGFVFRTSDRANIWANQTPTALTNIAQIHQLPCPDTLPSCAACGYCSFIKLSDDWTYFAYEQTETKNMNNIFVFKKTQQQIEPVDTLYGKVIHATSDAPVYGLDLQEVYWEEWRPKRIERYRFEKGHYVLSETKAVPWQR